MADTCDFLVIGAGIAGASAAAELASCGKTILLEREAHAGYHATGRSAAIFLETYGNACVRGLTRASRSFLETPPEGFSESALVTPRGALFVADSETLPELKAHFAAVSCLVNTARWLDESQILSLFPYLPPAQWVAGVHEPDALDLNVHALHQGYLRAFRHRGGDLRLATELVRAQRSGSLWHVLTQGREIQTPFIVNASGAWGDVIARRCGVFPLGLSARRRTAIIVESPADPAQWPYLGDIGETFYIKPDAGRLLASPCDETEVDPCDVQPEEFDVATIAYRLEQVTSLSVKKIEHRWAGLRTFAPDRTPVAGFAADTEGFFWLVGQGGYGIQTAPAMAASCRSLIAYKILPPELIKFGVTEAALSPRRILDSANPSSVMADLDVFS